MKRLRTRAGFTIIESLVAVLVAGVSVTALVFPLTASILLQRQEKIFDEARNLARLQMEDIRSQWSTARPTGQPGAPLTPAYNEGGQVRIYVDPASWRFSVTATSSVALQMATGMGTLNAAEATVAPTAIVASYPGTQNAGALTGATGTYYGINVLMPKSLSQLSTDYIGQILVGSTPGVGLDKARRVVIRIYAATNEAGTLRFAAGAAGTRASGIISAEGDRVRTALGSGPLAILVEDITSPPP